MRWTFGCDLSGVRWLCALLLCTSAILTSAGFAQEQVEPAGYGALLAQAQSELRHGNYAEARELFENAHRRLPNARTLRGLGVSAFELHNYPVSIGHLERALESTERPLDARLRKQAEALLERAYGEVGRLYVAIEPPTARAQVLVDGTQRSRSDERPLLLEPGAHQLEFRAPGYLPAQRSLELAAGVYEIWHVPLARDPKLPAAAPVSVAVAAPTPTEVAQQAQPRAEPQSPTRSTTPEPAFRQRDARERVDSGERPSSTPLYKSPWLWTSIGVAVAAGALAFGIMAARDTRVEHAEPVQTPNTQGILSALTTGGP